MTAEQSRAEESRLQAHCLGSKKKSPIAPERLRKCSFWFLGEESKELRRVRKGASVRKNGNYTLKQILWVMS